MEAKENYEKNFRPCSLGEFIGQGENKATLSVMIEAARKRGHQVDHLCLTGGPGLGKTTIAAIIATEMESNLKEVAAPSIEKPGDLVSVLVGLNRNDVLFVDEIHRLKKEIAEILYSAMEDFKVSIITGGKDEEKRTVTMNLARFTLVGATTDYGLLPEPLRARFGHTFTLDLYTVDELEAIIMRAAGLAGELFEREAARYLAERARGTPRIALRLFRRTCDLALVEDAEVVDPTVAKATMDMLQVDSLGLDKDDRRYLEVLSVAYSGGPGGLKALAASSAFDEARVSEVIEPWLLRIGLITRRRQGRFLTRAGWVKCSEFIPTLKVPVQLPSLIEKEAEED
jgi:holliday junction DNA helicase RuvB